LKNAEEKAGLAAGRRALLHAIAASPLLRNHRVIVVFDAARETLPSEPSPHPMLSVRFSTPPADADAAILDLLARSRGKPVTVVTADSDLAFEARRLGAAVIEPERWEPLKAAKASKPRKRKAAKEDKPQATSRDVDYWLGVFGDGSSEDE
jgi:predicted RNA-binding protein with PIN domain